MTTYKEIGYDPNLVTENCILCNVKGEFWNKKSAYGKYSKEFPNGDPKTHIKDYNLWKCPKCELIWVYDPDENYEDVYVSGNYWNQLAEDMARMKLTSPERIANDVKYAKLRIPSIQTFCNKGEFLEVGCSSGCLMKELKDVGFNGEGVELDRTASDFASEYSGLQCHSGDLSTPIFNQFFDQNYYDLLIAIDVLEHLKNPLEHVEAWVKLVKRGGLIFIELPNADWYKNDIHDSYFSIQEHMYHYNRDQVVRLFKKVDCICIHHSNPFTNDRQRLVFKRIF